MVNKWSDDTPRINKIGVLEIVPKYDIIRVCWRVDRIRQLRRRALDKIQPAPGCTRRPQHPNKFEAPQVSSSLRNKRPDVSEATALTPSERESSPP